MGGAGRERSWKGRELEERGAKGEPKKGKQEGRERELELSRVGREDKWRGMEKSC